MVTKTFTVNVVPAGAGLPRRCWSRTVKHLRRTGLRPKRCWSKPGKVFDVVCCNFRNHCHPVRNPELLEEVNESHLCLIDFQLFVTAA